MADTTYTANVTPITADTMNDVNRVVYTILGDPADVAAVKATLHASPGAIGSGTPAAGSFTTVVGATYRTVTGTVSANNVTATTLFDTSTNAGMYLVFAQLASSGAANYTASATVLNEGTGARIVANDGSLLTLTLSGTNVQGTQSSGSTQTITWSYLRVL